MMRARLRTCLLVLASLLHYAENTSYCDKITPYYQPGNPKPLHKVSLYWGSDPARAASELFAVLLRYKLGYQSVTLIKGSHQLNTLALNKSLSSSQMDEDYVIVLSTSWEPARALKWKVGSPNSSGLASPRLEEFGPSKIPARQRLHVYLAKAFSSLPECGNATQWEFYTNLAAIKRCGFINSISSIDTAMLYGMDWTNATKMELIARAKASLLHLEVADLSRKNIFQKLGRGNHSFLFLDYDIWSGCTSVRAAQPLPCIPVDLRSVCQEELDTSVALRVADVTLLQYKAPQLFKLAYDFAPTLESIRDLLELESSGINIEEAACDLACRYEIFENTTVLQHFYEILVYYPADHPYVHEYNNFVNTLHRKIRDLYKPQLKFGLRKITINNADDVTDVINYYLTQGVKQQLLGAAVGGLKNIWDIVRTVEGNQLPVLLYDAAGVNADSKTNVWLSTGDSRHFVLALRHFIKNMTWTRFAVLSDGTPTAERFVEDLESLRERKKDFGYRNHYANHSNLNEVLNTLEYENARIIFVNMNYEDTNVILSEVARLNLTEEKGFAWIVRDWRSNNKPLNLKLFAISLCCRGYKNMSVHSDLLDDNDMKDLWSTQAAALADAVLVLVKSFGEVFMKHSDAQIDVHSQKTIRLFAERLTEEPIRGVTQNLTYKNHSLEETMVFIEDWIADKPKLLARLRVNITEDFVGVLEWQAGYSSQAPPHDGTTNCIAHSDDLYEPVCYDVLWVTLLVLILSAPPLIVLVKRFVRRRLKEHKEKIINKELERRKQYTETLPYTFLVNRSALELKDEIGTGQFGCVSLGVLRMPGCQPRFIAVKALRENQEENEILSEACILASLNHKHIIRLVGVIIDNEPPLVLMERAFFGDLQQYLETRRYLAEDDWGNEEAAFVSAEALTGLARQAASALGYLASRCIIHRDLRASNCLVDNDRSLKLADFGLARKTGPPNKDGSVEYTCTGRGVFAVRSMAPESLTVGVFSAASDVWALGVLVFELVTLGARPYGKMSPQSVMQFVAEGGEPSMPRDASRETIDLTRLCWHQEPEERPSAAEVEAYLVDHPSALRPSFDCEFDQPIYLDGGFDESPTTELLPS